MKKGVQEAVDRDGSRLLVETIPALQTILGFRGVDKVDVNTRTDVQKRCFLAAFQKFVRAVCSPKRPLVLFLDDLQWTYQSSLYLFSVLAKGKGNDGYMLLGACRGNEVATDDSLAILLRDVEDNQIVTTIITMSKFTQSDVHGIVFQFLITNDGKNFWKFFMSDQVATLSPSFGSCTFGKKMEFLHKTNT
jgi:predicted ATPase